MSENAMDAIERRNWLALTPRDTVQVRDGRSFDAGAGGMAHSVRPWPSTIAGALVGALDGEPKSVRGPVLAHLVGQEWELHLPVPLDLVRESDTENVGRLRLSDIEVECDLTVPKAWNQLERLRLLSLPEEELDTEPITGLTPGSVLRTYLRGDLGDEDGLLSLGDLNQPEDPISKEARVGLGLDPQTRTAKTGALYSSIHLRLEEGWAFCAEVSPTPEQRALVESPRGPVRFGGLSRLADVEAAPNLAWPKGPTEFPEGKVLVYVATPAVWAQGWLPPLPADAELVAASVGDPVPVAIASPAPDYRHFQRTRTLLWAVPPGSVYYLKFTDPDDAKVWAKSAHGWALGPSANPEKRLETAGFGVVLTGVWS